MTSTEFESWCQHHATLFGENFLVWIGDGNFPERINEWYCAIGERASYTEACEASRMLARRAPDDRARFWPDHLGELLRLVAGIRQAEGGFRPEYGRFAHICGLCNNTGIIGVFPRENSRHFTPGGNELGPRDIFAVHCTCPAGEPIGWMAAYNPATMIHERVAFADRNQIEFLIERLIRDGDYRRAAAYKTCLEGKRITEQEIANATDQKRISGADHP